MKNILTIKNLTISLSGNKLLEDISFELESGKTLAIVGESGSGKSLLAKAILRLNNENYFSYDKGEIVFSDINILDLAAQKLFYRGKDIGLIMQDPFVSLNPVHHIKKQIGETLLQHNIVSKKSIADLVNKMLKLVGLSDLINYKKIYPHQLSGGQKQRVMIALSLIAKPKILIADEPTTSLDPKIEQDIIDLLLGLKKELSLSLIFISHDLSLVKKIADNILVLRAGKIVEYNDAQSIFNKAQAPYTKELLAAHTYNFSKNLVKKDAKAILTVHDLCLSYNIGNLFRKKKIDILKNISFKINIGETIGLIGNSAAGKSSLSKALLKLYDPTITEVSGKVIFDDHELDKLRAEEVRKLRKNMQIIFQDPFATLNPKMTIYQILSEALQAHNIANIKEIIVNTIKEVGLEPNHLERFPHQFSGGQRQRVAIARALCLKPKFIILDEPTASLDVTAQKQLLELLIKLQNTHYIAYLFISHNHEIIKAISHRVFELRNGSINDLPHAS